MRTVSRLSRTVSHAALATMLVVPAMAQSQAVSGTDFAVSADNVPANSQIYSPFVGQEYPNRVFWGDSHLHTAYSWDAGMVGARLGPDDAYRFARGEEVMASTGIPAKLVRPL